MMDRGSGSDDLNEEVQVETRLAPGPAPVIEVDEGTSRPHQPPAAWCAQALIGAARAPGLAGLVYAASSDRRADEIGRALRQFAPDLEALVLEPWDCLPYDRASPSREVMGRRMAVFAQLCATSARPRVLVASMEALLQRAPPPRAVRASALDLRRGQILDRAALEAFAAKTGYVFDDRIDEPGEIAILGGVVDIYPAAATAPVRIVLNEADRIVDMRRFDPLSQRTDEVVEAVHIGPASELILAPDDGDRTLGAEHRAPELYGRMKSVLDLCPAWTVAFDPAAESRGPDFLDQVREAYDNRLALASAETARPLPPTGLYLTLKAFRAAVAKRRRLDLDGATVTRAPRFALAGNPGRAFADHVATALGDGRRVVLTGLPHELRALNRAIKRGLDRTPETTEAWDVAIKAPPASLLALEADLDAGFGDPGLALEVIAAADVLGGRVAGRQAGSDTAALLADPDLRVGDVVIHEDHGLGVLAGLERVQAGGIERDALRLTYHGGADLLAPVEDFGRIWRYGAEREAVTLDRLNTDGWIQRRAELSAEIDRTAEHLVALARARARSSGAIIRPPKALFARLAARFPYPETRDQAAAIEAVLDDLASGRVMNRLVCGDVGFGKTEVALRAAAAVALAGKQVALVAPTTVLARQHFESMRRRFAGTDINVARLSRLATSKEIAIVKSGLRDGAIQVVVGTQALAGKDVAFKDLGLLIIDEEQRFGAGLKAKLRDLAPDAHRLTMTATPIPRTLQLAMVGIEDVSVIATPPARRRPIRTFLAPYDPATIATALRREKRRGGQSFVVAPRIEDLEPLADALADLVPELSVRVAHGELPVDELDEVMVGFASGEGDVLLATNIIESGLDVPRANTMLVTRADLFGLAQLHQLRGRVGRGRAQGVTYLFHAADVDLPEATRARLSTLEAFDRLGSGLAISARDLELRGAGDLLGEEQAGHLKLIGTALYQRLLSRAIRVATGEISGPDWVPHLNLGLSGAIPEGYVPDATLRINLYARLARLGAVHEVDAFAEELEDRFGTPPAEVLTLLQLARVQALAIAAKIVRIDAGPKAIAFTPAPGAGGRELEDRAGLTVSGDRWLWAGEKADDATRLEVVIGVLHVIARKP